MAAEAEVETLAAQAAMAVAGTPNGHSLTVHAVGGRWRSEQAV